MRQSSITGMKMCPGSKKNGIYVTAYIIMSLMILITSCGKKSLTETEPNDSFTNATVITLNQQIEGTLFKRDDVDFFRITVTDPAILDISLSPMRGINHSFKIWKGEESPVLVKHVDDNRKSAPERMVNFYADREIYYISVQHGEKDLPKISNDDRYALRISERAYDYEEREPNDTPANATHLELNREIKGYFSPAFNKQNQNPDSPMREEDWYSLYVDVSGKRPVLIDVSISGVPGVNSQIYLYGTSRELLGKVDAGGPGEDELLKGVGITRSGTYYLMIASKNYSAGYDKQYLLKVSSGDYDTTREMEPNNKMEEANDIVEGYIEGSIFPSNDIDTFIYRGQYGKGLYRIEMEPPGGMDIQFQVISMSKATLVSVDNSPSGVKEVYPNLFTGESFYLKVSSTKGYSDKDNLYRLKISRLETSDQHEVEPNDDKLNATEIKGNTINGYISHKRDIDYFLLNFDRRLKKEFTLQGVRDGRLKISITDPFGYIIKTAEVESDNSVSIKEMIDIKGYIIIESLIANYNTPYILNIREAQ